MSVTTSWSARRISGPLLIDSHVHIHTCFELDTFFSAALANFRSSAMALGLHPSTPCCLMLAETSGEDAFNRAGEWLSSGGNGNWALQETNEPNSMLAQRDEGGLIVVIAGRQVVSRDGLEVLGLGLDWDLPLSLSLEETVYALHEAGALPVVPWGFGKWWFQRGRRVMDLLDEPPVPDLFLGDNVGRPRIAKNPRQFSMAVEREIPVLPGTDPLPLTWHAGRAGAYGLVLSGVWDPRIPAREILDLLRGVGRSVVTFGERVRIPLFLRNQFELRYSRC